MSFLELGVLLWLLLQVDVITPFFLLLVRVILPLLSAIMDALTFDLIFRI